MTRLIAGELGPITEAVERRLAALAKARAPERLWRKDASLWVEGAREQRAVRERLGWLDAPVTMRERVPELRSFAEEIRAAGFRRALLIGMGGSSLGAELLRRVLGQRPGQLDLRVLDSTDPAAVQAASSTLDGAHCLYLIASKSGTTREVDALRRHFEARASPEQFVAITDAGTPLDDHAAQRGYRRSFLNPPDIGGRFSVLSYFGLVPAALLGADLDELLEAAANMALACGPGQAPAENPGFLLGAVLAEAALAGRDKLTLVLPPPLSALGAWCEQLVAESTGKKGRGILPIDGEPLGAPSVYGDDRLFARFRQATSREQVFAARMERLAAAGHPGFEAEVAGQAPLGGEIFRWQVATAVAASILGVNAFDQPDVEAAKRLTEQRLRAFEQRGRLEEPRPLLSEQGVRAFGDPGLRESVPRRLSALIAAHLERLQPGDHLTLLAFLRRTDRLHHGLETLRARLRDRFRVATSIGYGPRFLHSTGQLHVGGPNRGLFVMLTHQSRGDLPIPGLPYSFATLERAQAAGAYQALLERGRRVLHLHLTTGLVPGLATLRAALEEALRGLR